MDGVNYQVVPSFFLLASFFSIGAAFIRRRRLLELIRYLFVC